MNRAAPSPGLRVDVRSSVRRAVPTTPRLRAWAREAIGARGRRADLALSVVGSAEARRLNLLWRGRDYPTNVLSFPAPPGSVAHAGRRWLGDVILCAPVIEREARQQGKPSADHWAHLVVHGCLHLLGFDHETAADALRMERRERQILSRFRIPDPYLIESNRSRQR